MKSFEGELFKLAFLSSPYPVALVNEVGEVLLVSKGFEEALNLRAEDIIGANIHPLIEHYQVIKWDFEVQGLRIFVYFLDKNVIESNKDVFTLLTNLNEIESFELFLKHKFRFLQEMLGVEGFAFFERERDFKFVCKLTENLGEELEGNVSFQLSPNEIEKVEFKLWGENEELPDVFDIVQLWRDMMGFEAVLGIPLYLKGKGLTGIVFLFSRRKKLSKNIYNLLSSIMSLVYEKYRLVQNIEDKLRISEELRLYSRQMIEEFLKITFSQAKRYSFPLSLILVKVVNYEVLKRKYGRFEAGKRLYQFAFRMKSKLRASDIIGRYHEDSFLIVLPFTRLIDTASVVKRISDIEESMPEIEARLYFTELRKEHFNYLDLLKDLEGEKVS